MSDPRKEAWDSFQKEITDWAERQFPNATLEGIWKHFLREVNELETAKVAEQGEGNEIADCMMLLMHYAHWRGLSVFDEIAKKFDKNKKRTWGKPDHEGVVEHIREEP
jgi:NTP pyrophosphatase (non-canonical NTP hydrolase)